MELSVIVSSYKFKDYIVQCIDSILSQRTNFEFEVVVRDDASNDGTLELLREKYGSVSNVRILDVSRNVGAVENLIILMGDAKGKYVAHLDGDDYLIDNDYYQRAVDFLNKNKNYAMYSSGCKYLKEEIYPKDHWIVSAKPDFELKDLLVENYASFARVFKKTSITSDVFNKILYPDWAFNFEILKLGRGFCDVSKCVGIYRIHSEGMFSMTSDQEKLSNKKLMQKELSTRYERLTKKDTNMKDDQPKQLVDYCVNPELMEKCIFMQVYEEFLTFSYWVKGFAPNNILEIGTMGSTFWIMSKLSTGKKISADIEPRESTIRHAMYGEDWEFILGDTHTDEIYNKISSHGKFDLIFIDGDHTYDGVKKDFDMYKNLLSDRGYIAFHDIDPNHIFADSYAGQVYKFWKELDEGTKMNLVCTKSSGRVKLNGIYAQGFGGIGLWRPN